MKEQIIPQKYYNNALHIAIATIYEMDALVSWNLSPSSNLEFKSNSLEEG